jgi:outer membrane murein-binding lipoprotein Lpp
MKRLYWMPVLAASVLLGACASTVKPAYVSPTQYQSLNCQQLQAEYNRIQQYIDNGVQTPKRTGVGVGVGLGGGWGKGGWGFGPSISVNMGQSMNTKNTELANVLGQQDAIVQAAQFKGCPIIVKQRPKS